MRRYNQAGQYRPVPVPKPGDGGYNYTVSRVKWYQGVLNTTDADTTFRTRHEVLTDCHSIVLEYGNFYQDDDPSRLASLFPYTIKVVVEVVDYTGTIRFLDVTFGGGGVAVTVPVGGWVKSDPIGINLKKGEVLAVRTYVITDNPGKFPYGVVGNAVNGEGKMAGDQLRNTNFTASNQTASLCPLAIYGIAKNKGFESVACVGDSISLGAGADANLSVNGGLVGELGFMQIAAIKSGRGYISLGMNGQASNGFQISSRPRRMALAKRCQVAIVNYGTNDTTQTNRPLAEIQGNLINMWEALQQAGLRVYQTTIVPRTNSTDGWVTEKNQTPVDPRTAGGPNSVRSMLNDWIRSVPSPALSGYIEAADPVETSRNSGIWIPGMTKDGIHPTTMGHNLAADAVLDKLMGG